MEGQQGVRRAGVAAAAAWLGSRQQQQRHLVGEWHLQRNQQQQQRQMSNLIVPAAQLRVCHIRFRQLHSWLMLLLLATAMQLTQQRYSIRHAQVAQQQWQQLLQQQALQDP
jgi:hypothetical protein